MTTGSATLTTIGLLLASNIFMTFAWYGHLKNLAVSPLWIAVLVSWGIAFFEYALQVPANRIGFQVMSLPQLKIRYEINDFHGGGGSRSMPTQTAP